MKNSQIFEKKYFEIISKEEKSILQKFKEGVKNELQFNYVSNGLLKKYTDEINSIMENQLVKNSQRFIETNLDKYQGDQISKILKIIDNDFNSFVSEQYKEIHLNDLIENIALLYALERMQNNVSNNFDAYSFMYKLNDFKEFTHKNIKREKPELTEKLRLRIYPSARPDNKKRKKDYSRETENIKNLLASFSQDEKKVILKAFNNYIKRGDIKTTELIKLSLIISNIDDLDIFFEDKKAGDSSLYNYVQNDFTPEQIESLENLKSTFRHLKLEGFIKNIGRIKTDLLINKN